MATYQIFKETALPGTLQPHSIYLVAPAGAPDFVEMYVTGASASTVKRVIKASDVQSMIDTSLVATGGSQLEVVSNIADRNALSPAKNTTVLVLDATADSTVTSGAATYVYRVSNATWYKVSEAESQDIAITWAALAGKPSSTVAAIDDAVAKAHSHTNKTELDKIGEATGELTYNGLPVKTAWSSTAW